MGQVCKESQRSYLGRPVARPWEVVTPEGVSNLFFICFGSLSNLCQPPLADNSEQRFHCFSPNSPLPSEVTGVFTPGKVSSTSSFPSSGTLPIGPVGKPSSHLQGVYNASGLSKEPLGAANPTLTTEPTCDTICTRIIKVHSKNSQANDVLARRRLNLWRWGRFQA